MAIVRRRCERVDHTIRGEPAGGVFNTLRARGPSHILPHRAGYSRPLGCTPSLAAGGSIWPLLAPPTARRRLAVEPSATRFSGPVASPRSRGRVVGRLGYFAEIDSRHDQPAASGTARRPRHLNPLTRGLEGVGAPLSGLLSTRSERGIARARAAWWRHRLGGAAPALPAPPCSVPSAAVELGPAESRVGRPLLLARPERTEPHHHPALEPAAANAAAQPVANGFPRARKCAPRSQRSRNARPRWPPAVAERGFRRETAGGEGE